MANEKRLIDVDNAISHYKALANIAWNEKVSPVSWKDAFEDFVEYLEEAPTVDAVEVVHGKWEFDCACEPYCSVCGEYALDKGFEKLRSRYCPNCGAKMDGGNEDDL